MMKYQHVCIEGFTYSLPEEVLTTEEIERRLERVYERLHLPRGRLELSTGIRERRVFPTGTLPGARSVTTAERLLQTTEYDRKRIGTLIHGSVCSDYAEPATACSVHHRLGLPVNCEIYDVSNACLGIVNGMIQIANRIELGQIEAGIVVGTETGRSLLESTVRHLNTDTSITRRGIKPAFASLTIGSGSAAVLLTHRSISRTGNRLLGGIVAAHTDHCDLCVSETDPLGRNAQGTLMQTDAEELMRRGVGAAAGGFERFLREVGWDRERIDRVFAHQVGKKHRQLLLETLRLPEEKNFSTLEYLGNTGSCALPTAAAVGIEGGFVAPGERIALLGIGSGINVLMLAIEWNRTLPSEPLQIERDVIHKILAMNAATS